MKQSKELTSRDIDQIGRVFLPGLASLCWSRRQALLQEKNAAGENKLRWRVVIEGIEEQIEATEHQVTKTLGVLCFRVQEELF